MGFFNKKKKKEEEIEPVIDEWTKESELNAVDRIKNTRDSIHAKYIDINDNIKEADDFSGQKNRSTTLSDKEYKELDEESYIREKYGVYLFEDNPEDDTDIKAENQKLDFDEESYIRAKYSVSLDSNNPNSNPNTDNSNTDSSSTDNSDSNNINIGADDTNTNTGINIDSNVVNNDSTIKFSTDTDNTSNVGDNNKNSEIKSENKVIDNTNNDIKVEDIKSKNIIESKTKNIVKDNIEDKIEDKSEDNVGDNVGDNFEDISPIETQIQEEKPLSIKVEDVSMRFTLSSEKIGDIKEFIVKKLKGQIKKTDFWALKHISFEARKGDRIGVLGLNGAGKSTLLKIVSGVMKPTCGKLDTWGKIVPLIELSSGFDPRYTGRENIYLRAAVLGLSREFIEGKMDEIIEFAELEKFIDIPIRNYSSGMKARLGFSISTVVDPEILILDEVLSVGDAKFKRKSLDRMKALFKNDVTVLFVSHGIAPIREICNKCIWIDKGRTVMFGDSKEVCDAYVEFTKVKTDKKKK
ncbi:MAG: ATP-binding cassette domain-containing protein [Methanobacteriaceae archaeon]